ncbi:MAG: RNA polymerase factor sigma-54 [Sphingomonadaceae bacterium]|nr:RNA polymerase factor sigma-54 [Sphingomonadaceae bacterium]
MALGPRLDLRQSQSLVMTPQLQQAIRLLALSNLEVESFIAEEIEKNPLLESGGAAEPEPGGEREPEAEAAPAEAPDALPEIDAGGGEAALDIDPQSEDFHQDSAADAMAGPQSGLGLDGAAGRGAEDGVDFDSFSGEQVSLHEHLRRQAGEILSGADLIIADRIIEQIEETGYLHAPLSEIARQLGAPLHEVERVLAVIQTFDPAGVAARSLAECLALQAKDANRYDPAMARLIDNLDYLARGNVAALKRICGVDDEDMADMIRELRAYDPKPGCRYGGEPVQAVVPDLFVTRSRGGWSIELNAATLPRVLVNRRYHAELAAGAQDRASKAWLGDMLAGANWLVKALDQRQRTIVRVATEIVRQQEAFFLHGVQHLKPMTLAKVAEAIEMHESTVSRVTSNKYLSCERGLYELKYFFTSGVASADGGDAVSAEAVKSQIRALIAAEDPNAILSDDQLVDLLRAKGFDIARRTVAKYREALRIPSSVQRRREKAVPA